VILIDNRISVVTTSNLFNFIGDAIKVTRKDFISTNVDLPIWKYIITKNFNYS
tara:strand:- start:778 stop:936 length:159 start_codon:yes stop_codon:yes gene_type:complete